MKNGFDIWNGKTLFFTETTDPNGNAFAVLKGTLGQQMVQTDPSNNATVFYYDALGRLTESVDPDTISTYYEYDKLGRMVHRTHPDAGDDWYRFDPAGNIVHHVNGNGDTVRYDYYYNLPTNIYYPNNPANNVRYVYGIPGSPANTVAGCARRTYIVISPRMLCCIRLRTVSGSSGWWLWRYISLVTAASTVPS